MSEGGDLRRSVLILLILNGKTDFSIYFLPLVFPFVLVVDLRCSSFLLSVS
jgi:hypothetical protein